MRLALTSIALAYSMSAEPRRSFGTEIASASPKPPRFVDVDKFDVADGAGARAHLDERGFVVFRGVLDQGEVARANELFFDYVEALGSGVYYTTYIKSKEHLSRRFDSEESNLVVRLLSGSTAGVAGWTCIYPLDTLRSRVLSAKRGSSTTAGSVARDIFQQNGIAGFYRGLMPCLLRAIPVAATVLPTYDYVLDFLRE